MDSHLQNSRKKAHKPQVPNHTAFVFLFLATFALSCGYSYSATAVTPEVEIARQTEEKLTETIRSATASFVFIGGGSGVVISPDGYMLSNHHVAGSSRRWRVRIGTNFYDAVIIGNDRQGDISLLKIQNVTNLPAVKFADSDRCLVGQPVVAVGNPFGTAEAFGEPTVTHGIISAVHVFVGNYCDAIQTDAPVNPGNSGGPLLTQDGRLAGITGMLESRFQQRANTGIGLSIPVNQIARFLPALRAANGGNVYHGFIRGLYGSFNEEEDHMTGALVVGVRPGSTAQRIGLQPGDRIDYFNKYRLQNYSRFVGFMGAYPAGAAVSLTYLRGTMARTAQVQLDAYNPGSLGVKFRAPKEITDPMVIERVYPRLAGERAGLVVGDTLVNLNGRSVATFLDYMVVQKTQQLLTGDSVKLSVRRRLGNRSELRDFNVTLTSAFDVPVEKPLLPKKKK